MKRVLGGSVSAMAAAAAAAALGARLGAMNPTPAATLQPMSRPIPVVPETVERQDISRQRKRYAQRQARKAQRQHRKRKS